MVAVAARVVVFIDYQNAYNGARETFHEWNPGFTAGQFDPVALGEAICEASPFPRTLTGVRIYRGQPDATKEPKGHAACERQFAAWRKAPVVEVIARGLRYPQSWPAEKAEEKGIDVSLAIDFAGMAVRRDYDVGVLVSTDTDLKPALEFVCSLEGRPYPRCEVASWSAKNRHGRRLSVSKRNVWCHWLNEDVYARVADSTDYTADRS